VPAPRYDTFLTSMDQVLKNIYLRQFQLIDVRSPQHFKGKQTNFPSIKKGHIPGSINIPISELFKKEFVGADEKSLTEFFTSQGVNLSKPIATSSTSGISAAVLSLALAKLGITSSVYDGSWLEYAQPQLDNPITIPSKTMNQDDYDYHYQ